MAPLKKIKDHFYYKSLDKLSKTDRSKHPTNPLEAFVILIPEEYLNSVDEIIAICQSWNPDAPIVKLIGFLDVDKPIEADPRVLLVDKKDVNWKDIPSIDKLKPLLHSRFDVLINLDKIGRRQMEFTSAALHADIKIGFLETKKKIYDLLVDTEEINLKKMMRDVLTILKTLKKPTT